MRHPKQLSAYCSYLPSTHCAFALQQRYSTRRLLPFVYRAYVLLYAGRVPCLPCPELLLIETGNSRYKWNIHFNSNETRSPISITSKSQIGFPRYISKVKKVLIFWRRTLDLSNLTRHIFHQLNTNKGYKCN